MSKYGKKEIRKGGGKEEKSTGRKSISMYECKEGTDEGSN